MGKEADDFLSVRVVYFKNRLDLSGCTLEYFLVFFFDK